MDKIFTRICLVSRSVKFSESKAWWVMRKKCREKLRKILSSGVKEKLPTKNHVTTTFRARGKGKNKKIGQKARKK